MNNPKTSGEMGLQGLAANIVLIRTYRYLRVMMLVMVAMLATSIVFEAIRVGHLAGSISAYYYSPARPVLVGSLIAIGACMVIIKGDPAAEDAALNLAGILAAVVAFVPVEPPDGDTEFWKAAVANNIAALLVAGLIALGVWVWVVNHEGGHAMQRLGIAGAIGVGLLAAMLAAGTITYLAAPKVLFAYAHWVSAIAMFTAMGFVTWLNAGRDGPFAGRYRAIWISMATAAAAFGIADWAGWSQAVFWLEATEIALFAAFWVTQTQEWWDTGPTNA